MRGRGDGNERGVVAVMMALLLVVLLGCAALAVDVGMLYATRAQLQNGADAGALAIAQDCALNGTSCQSRATTTGKNLAGSNANSGLADAGVSFTVPGSVSVTTSARNSNGPGVLTMFANVFGISTVQVGATATAAWGGPYSGTAALPLAFSECQFNLTGTTQVLAYHDGPSCASSNGSGHVVPGGFGWLDSDPGKCGATITLANPTVSSKQGVSEPGGCSTTFDNLKNQIILLPVYDDAGGQGTNAWFHIKAFAAFQLQGFNFPGHSWNNTGNPSCTGSCKGLIGKFVRYVSMDQSFTLGGPDLGGNITKLTR
ncbi:pilus assembly protein TadG-related protein [Pseudarthrobacter sp. YAF2]|uniref:pilus assembly protein TadG-related protein n=1 Tax=Pseudarthrobacter sp. YAF2 TaxID=3233078 RepID=UPI003F986AD0